jgi:nuclease HARBI1
MVNELVLHLDETWKHLLDFDVGFLLSPERLAAYAQAIYETGVPIETIWAFLDCTLIQMCRPTWFQRQAFSGHKKYHVLKYQALGLPNGLIGHLFGPQEGRRNDNALAAFSGIFDLALEHAVRPGTDENTPIAERHFQIFGDPAYGVTPVLLSPFSGPGDRTEAEQEWNVVMSQARISIEHAFGLVLKEWPFLRAHWKHRVFASPLGRYYRVAVLLTNAQSCFHPNQTSNHFTCPPPSVQEYFHH